jgi:hypothetical protein
MREKRFAFGGLALLMLSSGLIAACSSSHPTPVYTDPDQGADSGDADTWTNFASGFVSTYCVECHNTTVPDPSTYPNQNFNLYADVDGLVLEIRCGVSPAGMVQSGCPTSGFPPPGQFPAKDSKGTNPMPSDADRLRMIAWINAGAPEN